MLKPKQINIKKIIPQQKATSIASKEYNKSRNSRKSLKFSKQSLHRHISESKPSPIQVIKKHTLEDEGDDSNIKCKKYGDKHLKAPKNQCNDRNTDDDDELLPSDHSDFIACINGYLHQLSSTQSSSKKQQQQNIDIPSITNKLKKQKSINRSLQKNILAFQQVLWQRTQKLQKLQQAIHHLQSNNKENALSLANSNAKSRCKLSKKQKSYKPFFLNVDASSQYQYGQQQQQQQQQQLEDQSLEYDFDKYKYQYQYNRRRRTQLPSEIQMMISKTMGMRPESKLFKQQHYHKY